MATWARSLFAGDFLMMLDRIEYRKQLADSGEVSLRPSFPVVLGMVLVVLSFAMSLGYSHFLLQPIDEQALGIMENALPSLQHLANTRASLAHLGKEVRDAAGNGTAGGRSDSSLSTDRQRVMLEFALYRALPSSSTAELEWSAIVDTRLAQLADAIEGTLSAARDGDSARAMQILNQRFEPALALTGAAVESLLRLNGTDAQANAHQILQTRRDATITATLLGCASLIIAILATLLVLRVLQGRTRITQQYLRLLTERSAELEAFAGRVAHDLRDPLSAIALQLRVVGRQSELSPQSAGAFEGIRRQLEGMNQIIEALLEFSSAGAAPAPEARADLNEVLQGVLASVQPRLEAIAAELRVAPIPSVQVVCPPGALSSVLSNLLGNAAKFVVEGTELPRRISVRISEREDSVLVEIEDNGPGIPAEAERRIFEPFQRWRGTRQPGFGLGLATVKKIIEAYHGRLGVRSRPLKGSVFWFELPKAPQAGPSVPSSIHGLDAP
jgi:signal transduction histidine kinase